MKPWRIALWGTAIVLMVVVYGMFTPVFPSVSFQFGVCLMGVGLLAMILCVATYPFKTNTALKRTGLVLAMPVLYFAWIVAMTLLSFVVFGFSDGMF